MYMALIRGIALFFGVFTLCNVITGTLRGGFDGNGLWVDMRFWPVWFEVILLCCFGAMMYAYAIRPNVSDMRRRFTLGSLGLVLCAVVLNAIDVEQLRQGGMIENPLPFNLSLIVGVILLVVMMQAAKRNIAVRMNKRQVMGMLTCAMTCCLIGSGLLFTYFGKTDYRRQADAAVVFGARVYASGQVSLPVADRVRTACELYHQGLVSYLIMSGGPGDGDVHETEGMKQYAMSLGVPERVILKDEQGLNTRSTVRNTVGMFRALHVRKVLAVSHSYHMPRVKMSYQQAGWEVYTVPAKESRVMRQMPYNLVREVAAFWMYYLKPVQA
ncbi:YdcF family protein [Planctomycetota bacterium]|nr:YdcF family protein [Planctomycetota bacterium]